jgi:hypothetical protein
MAVVDFSLLQMPNFAQSALAGYQAGQQVTRQRRVDAALQGIDMERPESILPLIQAGDTQGGAALLGASTQIANQKRDAQIMQLQGNAAKAHNDAMYAAQQAGAAAGSIPANPTAGADSSSAALQAPPASSGSDTNQAGGGAPPVAPVDPVQQADGALAQAAPDKYFAMQKQIQQMDDAQRQHANDVTSTMASIGQQALTLPYQQRRAFILAQSPMLAQHGVPLAMIQNFDSTDDNIHAEVGQALGVKAMLDQSNKDRSFKLDQDRETREARQGDQRIAQDGQRLGIEAGQLGVSQGNLAMRKQEYNAAHPAAGAPTTRTVGGKTYYQVGGRWFDNPEGK